MENNNIPLIPIKSDALIEFKDEITSYLKQVSWKADSHKAKSSQIDLTFLINNKAIGGVSQEDELSILKNAIDISNDRFILSNTVNIIVNAIRDGYCIGKHIAKLYEKASGLENLLSRNKSNSLHQSELPEFHDKTETQSAILLFTSASYIIHQLNDYRANDISSINIDFGGIPEVIIQRPSRAIQSSLYYYCAYLERSGVVKSELDMLKLTLLYFERLIEEISFRKEALKYTEFFTNNHYKHEPTEFVIHGFEASYSNASVSVTFNKVEFDQIIANKEAKHMFQRYVDRLMCHDIHTGKNPMLELGGLPSITMADGKPGTGKSMLIAATASLLKEKCDLLEIPFLFWPLPENIISTYQGGSAERAMEWFKPMQDSKKIIFAPIDDAENNLEERTRRGVSAGVREFIGVFLRNTEGAYAVNNGNRLISLFTNIPDQIDKAVLSRIQSRTSMDGAKTKEDFIDQDYIWWKKYNSMNENFIDATSPSNYEFLSSQKGYKNLSEAYAKEYEFMNVDVKTIYEKTLLESAPTSHDFFGMFYTNILKQYPFFSSRDLRNIQKAVDARIMDFDLPSVWWDKPEEFFKQDYDSKLNMIKELMISNMGNLSFSEIRLREALFYIDTAVRINETGINREIDEKAKQLIINQKAQEKVLQNKII